MQRFNQIDILRAIAVLLVLGRHMSSCPPEVSMAVHKMTEVWIRGGWIGVDLFFVLSGFLVSGLLFREHDRSGKIDAKRFLIRRGFKIYPPFWLLILATVGLGALRGKGLEWEKIWAELLFVQNYFPGIWVHTWSLAVEEHFYILLTFAFLLALRFRRGCPFSIIPAAFGVISVLCLGLRIWAASVEPYDYTRHLFPSHLRIDSLLAGVVVAYYFSRHREQFVLFSRRFRWPLLLSGVFAMIPAFVFPLGSTTFLHTAGFSVLYVGAAAWLIAFLGMQQAKSRTWRGVAYLGSHSYSVYLWHVPVLVWLTPVIIGEVPTRFHWPAYIIVYFVGSAVFGVIMANLIEYPVLKIRDRWFPSRSGSFVGVPDATSEDRSSTP